MACEKQNPIAIGGVGGSGTRIVAQMATEAGFYMGSDLNSAHDNLWFTLLLKRHICKEMGREAERDASLALFVKLMTCSERLTRDEKRRLKTAAENPSSQHPPDWLKERVKTAKRAWNTTPVSGRRWGWKEPNTHIYLSELMSLFPDMKYVHVIRHGLDMAFSQNQNQCKLWHDLYGLSYEGGKPSPADLLTYWCRANTTALEKRGAMGSRFFVLNFDAMCVSPEKVVPAFIDFMGVDIDKGLREGLVALPRVPSSMGRYKNETLDSFRKEDVAVLEELGYEV